MDYLAESPSILIEVNRLDWSFSDIISEARMEIFHGCLDMLGRDLLIPPVAKPESLTGTQIIEPGHHLMTKLTAGML
jgi:hypothetical protein